MAQCYLPSGNVSPTDTPCNLQAPNSACCPSTSVCLTNGYCMGVGPGMPNILNRVSCTDKSWQDSSCPQYCADIYPDSLCAVFSISQPDLQTDPNGLAQYCCDGANGTNNASGCAWKTRDSYQPFLLSDGWMIGDRSNGTEVAAGQLGVVSSATSRAVSATVTVTQTAQPTVAEANKEASNATVGVGIGIPIRHFTPYTVWTVSASNTATHQLAQAMRRRAPDSHRKRWPAVVRKEQTRTGRFKYRASEWDAVGGIGRRNLR